MTAPVLQEKDDDGFVVAFVLPAGVTVLGPARFARFDLPYTPWFLRRNEVLVDVRESES